jgi:DNA-binding transcriptional ArsR family regulator
MLQEQPASPAELATRLDAALGTVAYHVRILRGVGLIELVSERRVRGAVEHYYRAAEQPRVSGASWARASPVAKQVTIGSMLQTIDEYARASAAQGGFDRADAHITRSTFAVDAKGWRALAKAYERLVSQIEKIDREATARAADAPDDQFVDASVVLMLFESARLSDAPPPAKRRLTAQEP